jgi:thiamine-phosphate pyrophosphorylase
VTLPPLYPVVDEEVAALSGWAPVDLARAYIEGGARQLQVRAKLASGGRLLATCLAIREAAEASGALVIVNDRFDIALAADIRAVHVGQDDLPPALVRRWLGDEGIVGLSTHTTSQVDAALFEPISYLAVGPVFATTTKNTGYDAVGLELVEYAASRTDLPIVAIGGITIESARAVLDAGATSVAVIGDLLRTNNPAQRVREFVHAIQDRS